MSRLSTEVAETRKALEKTLPAAFVKPLTAPPSQNRCGPDA